jgi:hypothetical protein
VSRERRQVVEALTMGPLCLAQCVGSATRDGCPLRLPQLRACLDEQAGLLGSPPRGLIDGPHRQRWLSQCADRIRVLLLAGAPQLFCELVARVSELLERKSVKVGDSSCAGCDATVCYGRGADRVGAWAPRDTPRSAPARFSSRSPWFPSSGAAATASPAGTSWSSSSLPSARANSVQQSAAGQGNGFSESP